MHEALPEASCWTLVKVQVALASSALGAAAASERTEMNEKRLDNMLSNQDIVRNVSKVKDAKCGFYTSRDGQCRKPCSKEQADNSRRHGFSRNGSELGLPRDPLH